MHSDDIDDVAYAAGAESAECGEPRSSCPYTREQFVLRESWLWGWDIAADEDSVF